MPTFRAWLLIILVIVLLVYLLRKFVRRLFFIVMLLVIAFFIYGLFSPSGAARLWYNVKSFPQRVAFWMGGTEFVSYDSWDVASTAVVGVSSTTTKPFMIVSRSEKSVTLGTISAQVRDRVQPPSSIVGQKSEGDSLVVAEMEPSLPVRETLPVVGELPEKQPLLPPQTTPKVPSPSNTSSSPAITSSLSAQDIRDAEKLFGMLLR